MGALCFKNSLEEIPEVNLKFFDLSAKDIKGNEV